MRSEASPPTAVAVAAAARPSVARRLAELVGLFAGLPLLLRTGLLPVPRLLVLALVTAGCLVVLWRDPGFDRRQVLATGPVRPWLGLLARRCLAAAAAVLALVLLLRPGSLLAWPVRSPGQWLAGMAAYPFLSAWPQEIVYRVFFFHRYRFLFPGPLALAVGNALAFGILHTVYPNAVAPLLSIPAGFLLARTYQRTGTTGPVWVEHVLYGALLFTLGLGEFFYDGRP